MIALLAKLLIGHALCDYPLQGDFIGKFKSFRVPSPIPDTIIWWHLLTAHAAIQAGSVWFCTGSGICATIEFVMHWLIDFAKCAGWTSFDVDQLFHVLCKIGYVLFLVVK